MTPEEIQARFAELKADFDAGRLGPEPFYQATADLRYEGSDGVWYQIDPATGGWLWWNGAAWTPYTGAEAVGQGEAVGQVEAGAATESAPPALPLTFWPLLKLIVRRTAKNFIRQIPFTLLFMAGSFAVYFYLIVVKYDGYAKTGGAQLTLLERVLGLKMGAWAGLSGGVVLGIASSLLIGLVVNTFRKGPFKAVGAVVRIPADIVRYFREAGPLAKASLAGGAGLAMFMGYVLGSFANLAMAVGVGAMIASRGAPVLSLLIRSAWNSTFGTFQGKGRNAFNLAAGYVVMAGSSMGFIGRAVLPAEIGLAVGVVLLIIALVLAKKGGRRAAPVPATLIGLVVFLSLIAWAGVAYAHDGGWSENRGNLIALLQTLGGWIAILNALLPGLGTAMIPALVQALGQMLSGAGGSVNLRDLLGDRFVDDGLPPDESDTGAGPEAGPDDGQEPGTDEGQPPGGEGDQTGTPPGDQGAQPGAQPGDQGAEPGAQPGPQTGGAGAEPGTGGQTGAPGDRPGTPPEGGAPGTGDGGQPGPADTAPPPEGGTQPPPQDGTQPPGTPPAEGTPPPSEGPPPGAGEGQQPPPDGGADQGRPPPRDGQPPDEPAAGTKPPPVQEPPDEGEPGKPPTDADRKPPPMTDEDRAQRRADAQAQRDAGQQAAATAGSWWTLAGDTWSNIKNEMSDTWGDIKDGASQVGSDLADAARDVYNDPQILTDTFRDTSADIKNGIQRAGQAALDAGRDAGAGLADAARDVYNDPQILTDTLTGTAGDIKDGVTQGASDLADAARDVYNDPQILTDTVTGTASDIGDGAKNLSGLQNFENSWDPNRSLPNRLGQVGLGVMNLYGALQTGGAAAGAIKNGTSNLLGQAGNLADDAARAGATVAGLTDDAARAGATAAGLTDDAARAGAAAGGLTDDAARAGAAAGGLTDDAARAGAGAGGLTDDAARAGAGAGGLTDDAARAGAGATDDAARAGAGAAGTTDDAARAGAGAAGTTDDAARAGAGAAGTTDDAARAGAGAAGTTDDAARAGAGAGGATDDAARAGAGATDDAGRAGAGAADDGAQAGAGAAGETDDAAAAAQRRQEWRDKWDPDKKVDVSTLSDEEKIRRQSYGEYLKNRGGGKGSTIRPGDPSDFSSAAGQNVDELTTGYTRTSQRDIQVIADKHGVKIHTRPTTERASELLANNEALPKPELVKNKSINRWDTYLGATDDEIAKVGHFRPEAPPVRSACPELTDQEYSKVVDRFYQRADEFHAQSSHIASHSDDLTLQGRLVIDKSTGKPFTGDVDGYAIRGMNNETLPEAVVRQVERDLKNGPGDVMHGVHTEWNYSNYGTPGHADYNPQKFSVAETIDGKIRGGHAPGGEALVTYGAGETTPAASWWQGGTKNPLINVPSGQ